MLHGRNLKVYKNGQAIACSRSCTIDTNGEVIEVSSKTSARAKAYIRGRYDWKVEVSGLVDSIDTIADDAQLVKGDSVDLSVRQDDKPLMLQGQALCTSARCTATLGNLAQRSATFQGSGDLRSVRIFGNTIDSATLVEMSAVGQFGEEDILLDLTHKVFVVPMGSKYTASWSSRKGADYGYMKYNSNSLAINGTYYCLEDGKYYTVKDGEITSE